MTRFSFPSYCIGDLSWVDIQAYLGEKDLVLIPVASLEHLTQAIAEFEKAPVKVFNREFVDRAF